MDLTLENLKEMNVFKLIGLAKEFGLENEMQNVSSQEQGVELLWNLIRPKKKENIFEILNNAQKTYIKAKETLCLHINDLKKCMEKIPKDFATNYLEKNIKECEKIKAELKDNNTEILVFGETSSGKSLFLNLLMGDPLLTTTAINCTSAITLVKYDKNRRIRARKTNLKKMEDKELKEEKEANEDLNKEKIMDKFFKKKQNKSNNNQKYEYEWIQKDLSNESDIELSIRSFLKAKKENRNYPLYDLIELHTDSDLLENGITLIDSPGLNENENLTKMVLRFLPKTTGIICIVNAGQGVTQSLKRFLAEVAKQPNYSPSQMFIVVTHWDLFEKESDKKEFIEKMSHDIKSVITNFEERNVVKVNLKVAFNACKNKVENKDYTTLMDNLVPFFKRAFKLKLQKQWSSLKEIIRYTNNTIKVIYTKTQDIIDGNSLQLIYLLKELDNFEKNGDILIQQYRDFVNKKFQSTEKALREFVYSKEFMNEIISDLFQLRIPDEENAIILEAWLERKISELLIKSISTKENIKKMFATAQDEIFKGANLLFGKVLFDLNTFEEQMMSDEEKPEKPQSSTGYAPPPNLDFDDTSSFEGFTDGQKFGIAVTAPIWIPLVIAGGLLALPILGVSALAKKIKNANELKYIKNNEKKWKQEIFEKYWKSGNVPIIVDVFVNSCFKATNLSNENVILHVKQRIEATRELLKILLVKRQDLSTFEEIFLILKKEFDNAAEKTYNFYLFNIKHFAIHHRLVTYDLSKDGRHIEIGKGAYGTVYKGKLSNKDNNCIPVAIKELSMKDIEDTYNVGGKLSIQDLISEEDALIDLSCPQIIRYFGCYVKKVDSKISTLNLVMRLADSSLDSLISKNIQNPYDDRMVLTLCKDIALGLKFIHGKNWIHRDLKPANILILDNHALITDLGLCKPVDSLTNTICGTPLYMAPEIHLGKYKNTIDQWSYGLIIFELMNRGLKENSFKEQLTREYLREGIQVIIPKNWDPNFSNVVQKCSSVDPKHRPLWINVLESLENFKF